MPITASVGDGGVNRRDDTTVVQILLNEWRGRNGFAAIGEDGLVGPETIGAITLFQQTVTGIVDGRVDPNGPAEGQLIDQYLSSVIGKVGALSLSLLQDYHRALVQSQASLPASIGSPLNGFRSRLSLVADPAGIPSSPAPPFRLGL